jgi:hypothetical protein
MIEKGILVVGDRILLYSQPPEKAKVGIIENINYPYVVIHLIKRDSCGELKKTILTIDISKDIPISKLDNEQIIAFLSDKEIQRLKLIENVEEDIFAKL